MNKEFIQDIKSYVSYMMLPLQDHYYHHYDHALSVMERCIYLGTMEGCSQKEIELLVIAALFHDTGFIIDYEANEIYGSKIARNYLRTMMYPPKDIEIVEKIILATQESREPENLLERIIKDADMDNLGTEEFFDSGEKLRHEREMIQKIKIKDPDWQHASLALLKKHKFYTNTQRSERQKQLMKNAEKLKKELQK